MGLNEGLVFRIFVEKIKKYCRFPALPRTRDPKRISFAFHYLHTGIIFVPSSVDALISTAER